MAADRSSNFADEPSGEAEPDWGPSISTPTKTVAVSPDPDEATRSLSSFDPTPDDLSQAGQ